MIKEQLLVFYLFIMVALASAQGGYLYHIHVQYTTEPVPLATTEDIMRVMEGCK